MCVCVWCGERWRGGVQEDKPAEAAPHGREVAACAAAAAAFVRLTFSTLSALEDAGAAGPRSFIAASLRRQALDRAAVLFLTKSAAPGSTDRQTALAWDAALSALPPRDRLRTLFFVRRSSPWPPARGVSVQPSSPDAQAGVLPVALVACRSPS